MLKDFWQKHKLRIIHEVGSWLTTIISFVVSDGADILIALYNGDFSNATLMGLRFLIIKSFVKALLVSLIPQLFPLYRKNEGILPPQNQTS